MNLLDFDDSAVSLNVALIESQFIRYLIETGAGFVEVRGQRTPTSSADNSVS